MIKGTLPQFAGGNLNVFLFEDYFVYKQQLLQTVPIDQAGIFETELSVASPQLVNVVINDISKRFYVVPEQAYTLHINEKEIFIKEVTRIESFHQDC